MRKIILFLTTLLFLGCSIKSSSYYLLEGDKNIVSTHPFSGAIGVNVIELPRYFNQNNLAVKEGENRVYFINQAHWISDMDEHLTKALVAYLKRYFNTTDIYLYPWDVKKNVTKRVDLKIENFIYDGKDVILDASWEIDSNGKSKAKFFHTFVEAKNDPDSIVKSMDKAFAKLQEQVARSIK